MTKSFEIDGKKMHSIRYASQCTGYSHDYVTRLAREGKIAASQIGRNWYVDLDSLAHYASMMELEQKLRQQLLSDERKREHQIRELTERAEQKLSRQSPWMHKRFAFVAVALVVLLGSASAFAFKNFSSNATGGAHGLVANVAQVHSVQGTPIVNAAENSVMAENQEHLNFSHESFRLSTLADKSEGVLLLPSATSTSSPNAAALFSDEVKVMTDKKTGEQYVALLNDKGEVTERIPFVVVPVNTKKAP
jgi:hypothetical protein